MKEECAEEQKQLDAVAVRFNRLKEELARTEVPAPRAAASGFSPSYSARARSQTLPTEGSSRRVGIRTGGVAEEAHEILVSAFARRTGGAQFVPHGMGGLSRTASVSGQGVQDGSVDQSGQYSGVEFQSVQPSGTSGILSEMCGSRCLDRAKCGLHGVRVGEAKNPGPSLVIEFDLTRRDSTDVDSEPMSEHDATVRDSTSDTESIRPVERRQQARHKRLRLRWHQEPCPHTVHRDVRVASHLVEQLARRIGCVPVGAEVPRATRQQRWSPFGVPLMWRAASPDVSTPVLGWLD